MKSSVAIHVLVFSVMALASGCGSRVGAEIKIAADLPRDSVFAWPEDLGNSPEPVILPVGTRGRIVADNGQSYRHGRFKVEVLEGPHKGKTMEIAESDLSR